MVAEPIMQAAQFNQPVCWVWRHPRPSGVSGRCIGRTDVRVDRRKAKRLAHRIRRQARLHGLPRVVHTSSRQRCALVGHILRSWGWRHHVDDALLEMDFGQWDGLAWLDIERKQVDAWCDEFLHHRPGGGESLADVFNRVDAWLATMRVPADAHQPRLVVGHAGWILALQWRRSRSDYPARAAQWPAPPVYGQCLQI
jgi:alpha-ribazole phosphatase